MKARYLALTLLALAPSVAKADDIGTFLSRKSLPDGPGFGLREAYHLAEAQRSQWFGDCGMVILKHQVGDTWIFRTANGYAGRPGPDIIIVNPTTPVPYFEAKLEVLELSPNPRPGLDNGGQLQALWYHLG